jgi:hypothetical protein
MSSETMTKVALSVTSCEHMYILLSVVVHSVYFAVIVLGLGPCLSYPTQKNVMSWKDQKVRM